MKFVKNSHRLVQITLYYCRSVFSSAHITLILTVVQFIAAKPIVHTCFHVYIYVLLLEMCIIPNGKLMSAKKRSCLNF